MRRIASATIGLVCVMLLASCSFNPLSWIPREYSQLAADRMVEIVDAVNSQDSAALKEMFTEYARTEYSDELDDGLTYLLSLFPDGDVVWENPDYRPSYAQSADGGRRAVVVPAQFRISSGGKDYWLFFSDYVVNDQDPANIGVYGMGVAPRTESKSSGPEDVFFSWEGSVSGLRDNGEPGVYIPDEDYAEFSDRMMEEIVEDDLNILDHSGLRQRFTQYAQVQFPEQLDDEVDELFVLFPEGGLTWEPLQDGPVVREAVEGDDRTILLLSTYRVNTGGGEYWLVFADFTVNEIDPENLGLYALGVAPRTASGDSPQELALFEWLETYDVAATAPPGILISD